MLEFADILAGGMERRSSHALVYTPSRQALGTGSYYTPGPVFHVRFGLGRQTGNFAGTLLLGFCNVVGALSASRTDRGKSPATADQVTGPLSGARSGGR